MYHLWAAAAAALESVLLAVVSVRPLVALDVLQHDAAVTAHADELRARRALARVTRQQARVRAALGARARAVLVARRAVLSRLHAAAPNITAWARNVQIYRTILYICMHIFAAHCACCTFPIQ